jgi:hypothetical protein
MTAVAAHELVRTAHCRVLNCEEEAETTRGRYAYRCSAHRAEKAADARQAAEQLREQARINGSIVATARALHKQAQRVARAERRLDVEQASLRSIYLRFGVEAGFIRSRSDR